MITIFVIVAVIVIGAIVKPYAERALMKKHVRGLYKNEIDSWKK